MKLIKTIPALPVKNIGVALQFYEKKFHFECTHKDDNFAIIIRDDAELHLWAACDPHWKWRSFFLFIRPIWTGAESFLAGTASCRIEVTDIKPLFEEYRQSGVLYSNETTVEQTAWGTREFPALDLHRNLITFYQRV